MEIHCRGRCCKLAKTGKVTNEVKPVVLLRCVLKLCLISFHFNVIQVTHTYNVFHDKLPRFVYGQWFLLKLVFEGFQKRSFILEYCKNCRVFGYTGSRCLLADFK